MESPPLIFKIKTIRLISSDPTKKKKKIIDTSETLNTYNKMWLDVLSKNIKPRLLIK